MPQPPAVFRSTSPEVLETHRGNVNRGRAASARWRRFTEETGMEPAVIFHPHGAVVPGAHPPHGVEPPTTPPGWFWDSAQSLLIPSLGKQSDQSASMAAKNRLSAMEWVVETLPGVTESASLHSVTCLDIADSTARLEVAATLRGGRNAALEVSGAVWLIFPHEKADLVDEGHWERSRRYLLEGAVIAEQPSLEALLA